jgi:putative flippase GtrA
MDHPLPAPTGTDTDPVKNPFARNTITSIGTTALDFGTLTGLVELVHVDYVVATWLGTVVGSIANFTINKKWSFRSVGRTKQRFARFVLVQAGSSLLHTFGVWALTVLVGLPYLGSKGVTALVVYLAWNYPLNRRFVFSRADRVDESGDRGVTPRRSGDRAGAPAP